MLLHSCLFAQEDAVKDLIPILEDKLELADEGNKLMWMDSLSVVYFKARDAKFDSLSKIVVDRAIASKSYVIVMEQTGLRINYYNNTLGVSEKGIEAYKYIEDYVSAVDETESLSKLYIETGDSYYFQRDYPTSILFYDKAIVEAKTGGHARLLGLGYMYKGGSLSFSGEFADASMEIQEAIRIFKTAKDTNQLIAAKNTLSILYSQNGFFKEAALARGEAMVYAEKKNMYDHLVSFYFNAATDAGKQEDLLTEIENLTLGLEAVKNANSEQLYEGVFLAKFVSAYARQGEVTKAENYLKILEESPWKLADGGQKGHYLRAKKDLAFAKGDYQEALKYGQEYLEIQNKGNHYESRLIAEEFLYKVYAALGNKEKAYDHFEMFYQIKDSISGVQKVQALSYYQTLYETEKRDAQIVSQQNDIELLDAKSKIRGQWLIFGGLGLLGAFGLWTLLRSRNYARGRQRQQEEFSQELIKTQETERIRVARELHDSVGQKLMLLTKKTKEKNDPSMEDLADGTLEELRSIARGLHPSILEKLGPSAAISALINEVDANTNIFFTHEIENVDSLLSQESALHLYRMMQEVLNNMVKHSEAKAASIFIEKKKDSIHVEIKDNGVGFPLSEKIKETTSLGMKTLYERAKILRSKIEIISKPSEGTLVVLQIPT